MTSTPDIPENAAPDTGGKKRRKSGGELLFDRTVYTGIGFGVNEASSLWITDQFMHGKPKWFLGKWLSKEGFDAASARLASAFKLKDKIAHGKPLTGKDRAGNALLMVTLLSGGTLLLWPMKYLEDHKIEWVKRANHFLDRFRDDKSASEEISARDAEVEQAIACSSKQSWPSLLVGRVIACASSVATGTLLVGHHNNRKLMDTSEKLFTGSVQPEGAKSASHRYSALFGVETYSCAVSSLVLEIISKLFAKRGTQLHDAALCQSNPPVTAGSAETASDNASSCRTSHCQKILLNKNLSENAAGHFLG